MEKEKAIYLVPKCDPSILWEIITVKSIPSLYFPYAPKMNHISYTKKYCSQDYYEMNHLNQTEAVWSYPNSSDLISSI